MSKTISLTQGKFAIVDDTDFEWLNQWKWTALKSRTTWYAIRYGYEATRPNFVYMHRVILQTPEALKTHHLNGNGLDNRRDNICACTAQEHKGYHQGPYKTVALASVMGFGRNLRTMRVVRRNLSQAELAELAGTSRVFISHIEVGKMLPTPELKARLRKALNWTELDDEAFAILSREKKPA